MSTKLSTMKTIAVAIALMAGVSGGAHAGRHSERSENEALLQYLHDAWDPTPSKASAPRGESTASPASSPPVKSNSPNADPAPGGGAQGQLKQRSSPH